MPENVTYFLTVNEHAYCQGGQHIRDQTKTPIDCYFLYSLGIMYFVVKSAVHIANGDNLPFVIYHLTDRDVL